MTSKAATAVRHLLENGAADAVAVGAPGRPGLTYRGLRELVDRTGAALAGLGVGAGDRAAIVLPNGPAMASCFVAVAAHAGAAPLYPGHPAGGFLLYVSDLRPPVPSPPAGRGPARAPTNGGPIGGHKTITSATNQAQVPRFVQGLARVSRFLWLWGLGVLLSG